VSALITIIHVVICGVLIIAVLMQSGKAADLAGAFGGVGSQTAFGARGTANILSKMTTVCAILFMFTSLGLWILSGREAKSAVSGEKAVPVKEAPAKTETKKEPTPAQTTPAAVVEKDKKQPETKPAEAKPQPPAEQKKTGQETKK
jgi:preprotein translocase subunit SecG